MFSSFFQVFFYYFVLDTLPTFKNVPFKFNVTVKLKCVIICEPFINIFSFIFLLLIHYS